MSQPTNDRTSQQSLPSIQSLFPANKSASGSLESIQECARINNVSIGSIFRPKFSQPGTSGSASIADPTFAHDSIGACFPPAASCQGSAIHTENVFYHGPATGAPVDPVQSKSTQPEEKLPLSVLLRFAFQSLGLVFGDLGTAPLYVFTYTLSYNVEDPEDVIGALSLIIYSLALIPLLKYIFIVCKANDNGQGGALAMYSLLCRHTNLKMIQNYHHTDENITTYGRKTSYEGAFAAKTKKWLEKGTSRKTAVLVLVLIATSMLIGDGVLTPGIVVLAAFEGIKATDPQMNPGLVPIVAVVILVCLFSVQQFGIDRVGWLFAPIVLLWFLMIGGIGIFNIWKYDSSVLKAFSPLYVYRYFLNGSSPGWYSLGGIILCISGTEALFANLGYFPVSSVQIAFVVIVFPCLVLAYSGQAAYLMKNTEGATFGLFYRSVPDAIYWPTLVVATAAAIIASEASILAAYSAVAQAQGHSCFPRVKVVRTSKKFPAHIYVPDVNWILMLCCIIVTTLFQTPFNVEDSFIGIGNAYGTAILLVMIVTTLLTSLVMILVWRCHWILVLLFTLLFLGIEGTYLSAVIFKRNTMGWIPFTIALAILLIMIVWHNVTAKRYDFGMHSRFPIPWLLGLGPSLGLVRVPGVGLIYSEQISGVPRIFSHLVTNLPAIHSVVIFVCLKDVPVHAVPEEERFLVKRIGPKRFHMFRCIARYGYNEHNKKSSDDFEKKLFESLFLFLQLENHEEGNCESETESEYGQPAEPAGEGIQNNIMSSTVSTAESIRLIDPTTQTNNNSIDELEFVNKCRDAGVVHVLGNTVARARRDSGFLNKISIDYIYGFLRKICREKSVIFNIPQESLLNVGQIIFL